MSGVRDWVDRWGDWALALVLCVSAEYELWVGPLPGDSPYRVDRVQLAVGLALVTLPLAWRRRAPVAVLLLITGAVAVADLVVHPADAPLAGFIALLVGFYSVGAHCANRRALLGGVVALGLLVVGGLVGDAVHARGTLRPAAWLAFAVAWLVGRYLRQRRSETSGLRARAKQLEREREEKALRAAADERARIARELHDVVAHSVSVMVVQAQAAQRVLEASKPRRARRSARSRRRGRQALTELRRLLGCSARRASSPRSRRSRACGSSTTWSSRCARPACRSSSRSRVSRQRCHAGVDLSAYRIVQEALTNALKHAGPAHAARARPLRPARARARGHRRRRGRRRTARDRRQGLVGMRERVALYGGELESRPERRGRLRACAPDSRSARDHDDPRPARRRPGARPRRLPADSRAPSPTSRSSARQGTARRPSSCARRLSPTSC